MGTKKPRTGKRKTAASKAQDKPKRGGWGKGYTEAPRIPVRIPEDVRQRIEAYCAREGIGTVAKYARVALDPGRFTDADHLLMQHERRAQSLEERLHAAQREAQSTATTLFLWLRMYVEGASGREVGEELGVTRQRVHAMAEAAGLPKDPTAAREMVIGMLRVAMAREEGEG